jgi:hypothetical protein
MMRARFGCLAVGVCCVLACGAPPEAPGPVSSRAPGSDSVAVSEGRPAPSPDPEPVAPEPVDAGAPPVAGEVPSPLPDDVTAERTFAACTTSSYVSCDYIYVAMQEAGTNLCVQLALDNCGSYQQPGLPVDVPLSWKLTSGSAGTSGAGCVPGVFNATSVPLIDAQGTIIWDDTARRPSGLVIDVTVEPSRSPGAGLAAGPIALSTRELVGALPDCED